MNLDRNEYLHLSLLFTRSGTQISFCFILNQLSNQRCATSNEYQEIIFVNKNKQPSIKTELKYGPTNISSLFLV